MLVLDIKDTWGLLWLQNLKKKKKSRNEEREADLSQRGPPSLEVILPRQCLALERRPWEAATGNADRNKSVRPTLLSVLQSTCFCFLHPPLGGSQISLWLL